MIYLLTECLLMQLRTNSIIMLVGNGFDLMLMPRMVAAMLVLLFGPTLEDSLIALFSLTHFQALFLNLSLYYRFGAFIFLT